MYTVDHLLTLVEPFRAHEPVSLTKLSKTLFGDGKRLKAMLAGSRADTGSRNVRDGFQWFSDHWPTTAPWPDEIPRPPPQGRGPAHTAP